MQTTRAGSGKEPGPTRPPSPGDHSPPTRPANWTGRPARASNVAIRRLACDRTADRSSIVLWTRAQFLQHHIGRHEERILLQDAADDDHRVCPHDVHYDFCTKLVQ